MFKKLAKIHQSKSQDKHSANQPWVSRQRTGLLTASVSQK